MRPLSAVLSAHLWGGTAWAGSTGYTSGDVRANGGAVYLCTGTGTSASTGGPSGSGQAITDGGATWAFRGQSGCRNFQLSDLFEITIRGTTYRLTNHSADLTWGGNSYSAAGAILERARVRQGSDGTLDDLDLSVKWGDGSTVGGTDWRARYLAGDLWGAPFKLYRAYRYSQTGVVDTMLLFEGFLGPGRAGETEGSFVVRPAANKLTLRIPKFIYGPQCVWNLYDAGCGATRPTTWDSVSVAAGSTASVVRMASTSQAADFFLLGMVEILSGVLTGHSRSISSSAQNGSIHELTVTPPFPTSPAEGVTIRVRRGCKKSADACSDYGRLTHMLAVPLATSSSQAG